MTAGEELLELVPATRGHFRLESGYHSDLWLDLDALFTHEQRIRPLVEKLTSLIRPYSVSAVCGPLLGGAFLAQLISRALGVEFWFTERVASEKGDALFSVRYVLPDALARRARGHRVAMVDDVMSAGSALRGTYGELGGQGAMPVVAGALLVLGRTGADYFGKQNVPVAAATTLPYATWLPADCPRCRAGETLTEPT